MAQGGQAENGPTFSQWVTGISVGVGVAGTTVDGFEYTKYSNSRFGGFWLGKNGKYYSTSWGGNGATGGMLKFAKAGVNPYLKAGGRFLGFASSGLGAYEAYQGYQNHDNYRIVQGTVDAGFGLWATLGGPIGWAAGGGYAAGSLINALTGFDQKYADYWVYGPGDYVPSPSDDISIIDNLDGGPFW